MSPVATPLCGTTCRKLYHVHLRPTFFGRDWTSSCLYGVGPSVAWLLGLCCTVTSKLFYVCNVRVDTGINQPVRRGALRWRRRCERWKMKWSCQLTIGHSLLWLQCIWSVTHHWCCWCWWWWSWQGREVELSRGKRMGQERVGCWQRKLGRIFWVTVAGDRPWPSEWMSRCARP